MTFRLPSMKYNNRVSATSCDPIKTWLLRQRIHYFALQSLGICAGISQFFPHPRCTGRVIAMRPNIPTLLLVFAKLSLSCVNEANVIVAVLLIILGIGFITVLSIIAFAYFCEMINHFRERRVGQRLSIRPVWGMTCLGVIVLFVHPLLNSMYFRGTTAHYVHPDYNQQNFFFEINSDGFRGPPVSVKRSDKPRLLFLGDSTAFGWPYRNCDAYPHLVKAELQEQGITGVESINAGTIGQSIAQIRHQLPHYLRYKPDLVFIMTGIHYHRVDEAIDRLREVSTESRTNQRLTKFLPPMLCELGIFSVGTSPLFRTFRPESDDVFDADREIFGQELRKTIAQIREAGSVPYLIEYPTPGADRRIQVEIQRICAELNVGFIPLFERYGDDFKKLNHDSIHPNLAGHRLIAREVGRVAFETIQN